MVSRKANSSSRGSGYRSEKARPGRVKPPLDETRLRDLALSYAARFATTATRLEAYLVRKLRERGQAQGQGQAQGEDDETPPIDIAALVARLVELGYVDDDAYAQARARDLGAKGYGARRVDQSLRHAGVDEGLRTAHAPGEAASRRAAALMARKRRIGPFASETEDGPDPLAARTAQEKAIAAMLRAGHSHTHARFILNAESIDDVEEWIGEAEGDEGYDA